MGSADTNIKPFVDARRIPESGRFYRRSVPEVSASALSRSLQTCKEQSCERVVLVMDVREDRYQASVGSACGALKDQQGSGALGQIRTVEFLLDAEDEGDTSSIIGSIQSSLNFLGNIRPHIKFYILRNPGAEMARYSRFASFVTAWMTVTPSRVVDIGRGLEAIRLMPESALFLVRYEESPVPEIREMAKQIVNDALWKWTFSTRPDAGSPPAENRIEQLLRTHRVGVNEPTTTGSFEFFRRFDVYRKSLLHLLLSNLVQLFPNENSFLEALDRFSASVRERSPVLRSLLVETRNEIVAAHTRMAARLEAPGDNPRQPGMDSFKPVLENNEKVWEMVSGFIRRFRFAIWPLLDQRIRPVEEGPCLEGISREYEQCITSVRNELHRILKAKLWKRLDAMKEATTETAARMPGPWKLPESFLFVHEDVETDRTDELWPNKLRAGYLGMIQKEHHA